MVRYSPNNLSAKIKNFECPTIFVYLCQWPVLKKHYSTSRVFVSVWPLLIFLNVIILHQSIQLDLLTWCLTSWSFFSSSAQPGTLPVSRVQWPVSRTHSSVTVHPSVTTEVTKTLRTPDVPTQRNAYCVEVQVCWKTNVMFNITFPTFRIYESLLVPGEKYIIYLEATI